MEARRKIVLLISLPVLGILVFFGARVGLDFFKDRQAEKLAKLARQYAGQGLWEEAAMSADTALRLNFTQPDASRFMAQLMEAEGRWQQAMELYGRLYESGDGTLEDLKNQALAAARGEYNQPARWLAGRVAEQGEPEFPSVLEAEMLLQDGNVKGAYQELRRALADSKNRRSVRAAMLRFLLIHPRNDGGKELLETIWSLKDGNDAWALEALVLGLSSGVVPVEKRGDFVAAIRRHPQKNARALILADNVEVALDPTAKDRVASRMISRLRTAGLEDRMAGAAWLNSQRMPSEAVDLLPLEDALSSNQAMKIWLDAQAMLGEWDEMRTALAKKSSPVPDHMAKVYTARALKMSGRAAEAEATYTETLAKYGENPELTAEILEYLHRSGEYALFDTGLAPQLDKPGVGLDMMKSIVPVVLDARDSARMRDVLGAALASPNLAENVSLMNDADYLDLVLGRPVDARRLRTRHLEFPSDPASLTTLALERLKAGNESEALALLENAGIDPRTLAPNQLTVLASVLAANGRRNEAAVVAARIPATRVSKQELGMLRKYFSKTPR